jgi:hypothetical protein
MKVNYKMTKITISDLNPGKLILLITFLLNSHNVFDYLVVHGLCNQSDQPPSQIEPVALKQQ